jgi:hypothetical protein
MKPIKPFLFDLQNPVSNPMVRIGLPLLLAAALMFSSLAPAGAQAQTSDPEAPQAASARTMNMPFIDSTDILGTRFREMGIFWLGQVGLNQAYADVRMAYNQTELSIFVAVIDRRLWYDKNPTRDRLEQYDALTLLLSKDPAGGGAPTVSSYRFVSQLNAFEARANYNATYQGNGQTWVTASIPFVGATSWRGDGPNDEVDDRGWTLSAHIPFSSLGLSGPPAQGTRWRLGVALHDRDLASGNAQPNAIWPEGMGISAPSTWGWLRFGVPVYSHGNLLETGRATIRHKLNGAVVPDAEVGGHTVCGAGTDYFANWGNINEAFYTADRTQYNIQNQEDISDFPCFSKIYITFPLSGIPAGRTILSASLTMYQFGNADPNNSFSSLIQAFTIGQDWNENEITWNNAPLAVENVASTWAQTLKTLPPWPGVARTWDISYAAAQAYAAGQPLRLALYSADSAQNSGKYFTSSNIGDWDEAGRPTVVITWNDPGFVVKDWVYLPVMKR